MATGLSTVDTIKARKKYNDYVVDNAVSGSGDADSFETWAAKHYATGGGNDEAEATDNKKEEDEEK